MLTAFVADTHITERKGESGMSLEEQVELLKWIGKDAAEHDAQVLLHGGDIFDGTTTPAERNAALEVFEYWAGLNDGSLWSIAGVRGNHDRPGELNYLNHIGGGIRLLETPETLHAVAEIFVATLPWPNKAMLAAALAPGDDIGQAAADALKMILQGIRLRFEEARQDPEVLCVLLAHAELGGAKLDNGQPVAGRCDVALHEADLLDVGADVVLLGHIHMHQTLGDGRIVYAGSPRPTAFGDETAKGYCLIDVQRGQPPQVEHRRAPYREMVTIDLEWEHDHLVAPVSTHVPGAAIRLRWTVDESNRATAQADAERLKGQVHDGAHSVKLDPRITTVHRVRSEEIREARTNEDRLEAWWAARGDRPGRAKEILEKLGDLEGEVAAC